MTHYEERLEHDLGVIREQLAAIASQVEVAVGSAVKALLGRDRALAAEVILGDLPINRATREVDRLCHSFVARHLPSAGHLRFVSAVMRTMVAVERVGDYAVTIAREAVQLESDPPVVVARDIEMTAEQTRLQLSQSLAAFAERDPEKARSVKALSRRNKTVFGKVFTDLLGAGEQGQAPLRDLFALLIVLNRVERIGDQAKNICEETVFAATGETKQPKVYRVLFVDEHNSVRSVMAEAMARKAFPESGEYASAGWTPADSVEERVVEFLDRKGHDVRALQPAAVPSSIDDLGEYHVIVGLGADVAERLAGVPFHTAVVEWSVGPGPDAAGWELSDESLEQLSRELSVRIRALMETLRGDQAA